MEQQQQANAVVDLWSRADNPPPPPPTTMFGQVSLDLYACVLVKGSGKVPFDASQHKEENKRINITITLTPVIGSPNMQSMKREHIDTGREWGVVLNSIKALSVSTRDLNGKWVQAIWVPDGRTYKDKQTGQERQSTTFKFVKVFADENECAYAREQFAGETQQTPLDGAPWEQQPSVPQTAGSNPERDNVAKFLSPMLKGKTRDQAATLLSTNPLLSKWFTIDSPEVVAIVGAQ